MVSEADNDILIRTGPGTAMGQVMRRYWMPALLTAELPDTDCPPVRVRLLGESLVAFRDTSGQIGLLEDACPHRQASLFLGRNEENGLRCVFHGWKFDRHGRCLDMMNEPPDSDYKDKINAASYPVLESGGVVWAYLGPGEQAPPPPNFEWTQLPAPHCRISKNRQECNWLQGLEGGIDTAHAPILHRKLANDTGRAGIGINPNTSVEGAPTVELETTDYGFRFMGIRNVGEKGIYVRGYHFVMPFHQLRPRQAWYRGQPGDPTSQATCGFRWTMRTA